jgi:putative ABC transport system ATP-binding protein
MIQLSGISKTYRLGGDGPGSEGFAALSGIDLHVAEGEFVALTGASGSGKSTLMNILGCLDTPTSGRYVLDGEAVAGLSEEQQARVRSRKIGFIFQNFHLLPRITAWANRPRTRPCSA